MPLVNNHRVSVMQLDVGWQIRLLTLSEMRMRSRQ